MAINTTSTRGDEAGGVVEDANLEDEKPRTLFVGNVSREVNKRQIEDIFGEVGPLKRCYIQYPRAGNEKRTRREESTVAYVTYALAQDALKALETLQNTKIGSNKVNIKFVKARSEQAREPPVRKFRNDSGRPERSANFEPMGEQAKAPRVKQVKKKARLIVRNLSWKVTDGNMQEHFQQCGEVRDVNILKKANGKLVGCAFIQYANVFQAAKAIKELNLKEFLGRPIAIDWALPKEKYQTDSEKQSNAPQDATDQELDNTVTIKDEPMEVEETDDNKFDASDHYSHLGDMQIDVKEEPEVEEKKRKFKRESSSSDEEKESTDDENISKTKRRKKQLSNDVEEGKTLFLRNLSFDTKEDNLQEFFEKYGALQYAVLCKDSLTEHPKGTGFVKFKDKTAADSCLQQYESDPTQFTLARRQLNVAVALPRGKIELKAEEKVEKPKLDSRNLFLVREGFIRPGSAAANDVSVADMNKRRALNQVKKQMLKNLSIFISSTRVCIHNLPPQYSDKQLRKLFKKHAGSDAKITEARIMRDSKETDLNGKGKSKGYGFVNFSNHEHALEALRSINNNPGIFTANQRPIVEFSLENRAALKAKERREQKSKEKNPNFKSKSVPANSEDEIDQSGEEESNSQKREKVKERKNKALVRQPAVSNNAEVPKYAGLVAKPGTQTVPSFKAKGKISRNNLKVKKTQKRKQQHRRQREAQPPSKRNVDRPDKTEKIISSYSKKLFSTGKYTSRKAKKWYD